MISTEKKEPLWTDELKKKAKLELLQVANKYEVRRRKFLKNVRFNSDGSAKWSGHHNYTVWIDSLTDES